MAMDTQDNHFNFIIFSAEAKPETNPCQPYPCGPNTYCKVSGKRAVCTCTENFVGDPKKGCKPECVLNTDCGSDKVCINYQCRDPCGIKNVCGLGAVCLCRDHMPTCICREGFTGNPFIQCVPKRKLSMILPIKCITDNNFNVKLFYRDLSFISQHNITMHSITMRSLQRMPRSWHRCSHVWSMYSSKWLLQSGLSSRMFVQCRLPIQLGLLRTEMFGSLRRSLWYKRSLYCCAPFAYLLLSRNTDWKCLRTLLSDQK